MSEVFPIYFSTGLLPLQIRELRFHRICNTLLSAYTLRNAEELICDLVTAVWYEEEKCPSNEIFRHSNSELQSEWGSPQRGQNIDVKCVCALLAGFSFFLSFFLKSRLGVCSCGARQACSEPGHRCSLKAAVAQLSSLRKGGVSPLRRAADPLTSCSVKWPALWSKVVEVSSLWGWCTVTCSKLSGWEGGLSVCVCVCQGRYLCCGGLALLQLCVCLSMSEWITGQGSDGRGAIQVQKCWSIKSPPPLPLFLFSPPLPPHPPLTNPQPPCCCARRKAAAICAISQLTASLKLWQPCGGRVEWGGGHEGWKGIGEGASTVGTEDGQIRKKGGETRSRSPCPCCSYKEALLHFLKFILANMEPGCYRLTE